MPEIGIVYLYPLDSPMTFDIWAERWAGTYRRYDPGEPHRVIVTFCNGKPHPYQREPFRGLPVDFTDVSSQGVDGGAYQQVARKLLDFDFVVFMNARTHFWKAGWLTRLLLGRESRFDENGLYAPNASYEWSPHGNMWTPRGRNPHLRMPCIATRPSTLLSFPYQINTREECFRAECGAWNLSQWYMDNGYQALMVTWDGVWDRDQWRTPRNIFRRGDQSNCLIHDKHHEVYRHASPVEKLHLERSADTGLP